MTTATEAATDMTPTALQDAQAAVQQAASEKEDAAIAARKATEASKADPDNDALADEARLAKNAQRRTSRALKKAQDALTELEGTEPQSELEQAQAEYAKLEVEQGKLVAALKEAEAATVADPDNKDLFSAARKVRWDEMKAGKALKRAAAKVEELGGSTEQAEQAEQTEQTEQPEQPEQNEAQPAEEPQPVAEAAPAAPAGIPTVAEAERLVAEAEKAAVEAETATSADPDDKKLAATARRARSAVRKANRALKKAVKAAEENGDDGVAAADGADSTDGAAENAENAEKTASPEETAATGGASLQEAVSLVQAGSSVLTVAADAAERAAAAAPGNVEMAAAATAVRAAQQQAAEALRASQIANGDTPTEAESEPEVAEPAPEDPSVIAAREALAAAEAEQAEFAEATKQAEAATDADPDNKDLFSAARKARWNELKAGKAVSKAAKALDQAIADAPPAPKVLTEEEKADRKAPKPVGQWLIDGKDPLNNDERIKQEDAGLAVADRVREIYAKQGFDSIPAEDLAPRFKWIGLYTQRRQDMDGEQTSLLTNAELQDRYFMMRVRLDGGVMSSEQMRVIGGISSDFARGTADFTDRQNIQLHWIRIEDVPEIWDRLASVGLDTFFGCGDVPRVVLGSPVAGISKDEIIDATPAIKEIKQNWLTRDEFCNLPRKFKSAISGNRRQDVTHEIQDISFIGSEHPEHGPGFDLWVGGGLSTNPMFAQRLGAWVPLDKVPEVWAGVVRIFRDYGYRKLRNRARLKFLVADWGIEKFRRILEDDYLGYKLDDGPEPEVAPGYRDHVGVHEQRDGRFYVGVKPTVGHTEGDQLQRLADIAEKHGITDLRTTPDKELLFLNVESDKIDDLLKDLEAEHLSAKPSSFRRDIISCTGLEFCKLALVTTKQRAITLADQLEERLGDLDVPLKISLNGCPNSCARTQVADIGLKGQIVTDDNGNRVEGFQVHLGGAVGMHPDWGKKLRGHKVTSAELDDYVVRVVEHYKEQRAEGEQFRDWVLRADEAVLQ